MKTQNDLLEMPSWHPWRTCGCEGNSGQVNKKQQHSISVRSFTDSYLSWGRKTLRTVHNLLLCCPFHNNRWRIEFLLRTFHMRWSFRGLDTQLDLVTTLLFCMLFTLGWHFSFKVGWCRHCLSAVQNLWDIIHRHFFSRVINSSRAQQVGEEEAGDVS